MIWFYGRGLAHLVYEIHRESLGDGYEIVVKYPDGKVRLERVSDSSELLRRSDQIRRELEAEGWAAIVEQ